MGLVVGTAWILIVMRVFGFSGKEERREGEGGKGRGGRGRFRRSGSEF